MNKIIADEKNVKLIGRTYLLDGVRWLALSGTGIEFEFTGKKFAVNIAASAQIPDPIDRVRIAVYVGDERIIDDMLDSPRKSYTVIDSENVVTEKIRIIKLSESPMSVAGIEPLETDGEISPTAEKPLKIEFIGDSITCGYGVDDCDPLHQFSTATEDVTRAYAYKTAKMLDADYSMFSASGYGIISGYTENDVRIPEQTIPQYYRSLGFSYRAFADRFSPQDIEWDNLKFVPDIVVINLGTNDDSYCGDDLSRQQLYTTEYVRFLYNVREFNKDAIIVCTVGIMGQRIYKALENAVNTYIAESGDEKVLSYLFDEQVPEDGLAANYHPTEKTHDKAAQKLTAFLRERVIKK